jgi:hypothetical protein
VASLAYTPTITLPIRLIAPSFGGFAITWLRVVPMAWASGFRTMNGSVSGIAG